MQHENVLSEPTKADVEQFERDLNLHLRHFKPRAVIEDIASRIHEVEHVRPSLFPSQPHYILAAIIDASCAYYRQHYFKPFDSLAINSVINLYHDRPDGYAYAAIVSESSMASWILHLQRTQFSVQNKASYVSLGRILRVFCRSPQSSFLSQCFAEQYGLSFRDWIDIAIAIFVRLHKKPRPIVRREQICIDAKRVTPVSVQRFLELASITPNQISDRYNTFHSADGVSWKLRCQYRPAVLEFPIILDDDDMIVPFPNLLWNLIEDKLFLLTKQIENTRRHLGDAFEHYVASILEEFPHPAKVEKVPVADRKRCDFSAKYTSGRVLVECKTISFLERKFLTHTAVANSGTISEIVDAIEQLVVTAEDLSDMSTHTDGIVVIWGEFMAANSDAVWETIYLPKLASKGIDNDRVRRSFRFRPQILTVEGLELLLMYCDIRSCEISQAIREKDGKPYSIVGEWPQYIMNSVGGLPCSKRSFWNALSDSAFLEALGFNEQDLQSYRSS